MTCPEAASDLGAYVLGALEPDERRAGRGAPAPAARPARRSWPSSRALPGLLDRVRPGGPAARRP